MPRFDVKQGMEGAGDFNVLSKRLPVGNRSLYPTNIARK
jgi:hypothetical protein